MTLICCKFSFSRNFALVGMFARQQLNEWRQTRIVSDRIVAHWKYFSTMYRLRWYCWVFLSEGRFSELRPIYQGCCVLTFALALIVWHCIACIVLMCSLSHSRVMVMMMMKWYGCIVGRFKVRQQSPTTRTPTSIVLVTSATRWHCWLRRCWWNVRAPQHVECQPSAVVLGSETK